MGASSRKALTSLLLVLLLAPPAAAKQGRKAVDDLPPWADEPDRVKLDIAERLIYEKKQYATATPIIAAMRKEGVKAPVLDLLQGIAMREQGMVVEAERLLNIARQRMPGDARVWEALCVLYADTSRLEEAVASCEKSVRLDEKRASSLNNLGFLYLATDRAEEALDRFQQAVEQDGSENRYRNNLGIAHVANGDDKAALAAFSSANEPAEALFNLGTAVERYRGTDEALPFYRDVLSYDSAHRGAVYAIDRITNPSPSEETEP